MTPMESEARTTNVIPFPTPQKNAVMWGTNSFIDGCIIGRDGKRTPVTPDMFPGGRWATQEEATEARNRINRIDEPPPPKKSF